jgi:predicted secreted hydrolase
MVRPTFARILAAAAVLALTFASASIAADQPALPLYPEVRPGVALNFPADHGAHPQFRTEWWYITGWLDTGEGRALGFQVTFFRTRPAVDENNPSAFAAKQILFAHAALSDPSLGHLLHDQRAARAGFGLAQAAEGDTDVVLDDWSLKRGADDIFHAKVGGKEFALDLAFTPTQAVLLEGESGYSRKGPAPSQASHYYSLPHLQVSGSVERGGRNVAVKGSAWLDREWSSAYLDPRAVGWDWVGLNLDDGGAVMAFRIRDAKGGAVWAGGTWRDAKGALTRFAPGDVHFTTERRWHSPRTGTDYPVEQTLSLNLPTGERRFRLRPLFDDQELDSRRGGGPVYWEGAAQVEGGRGYLELTGYFKPLRM